jgi:ribosomal protein S18 acetylase RimI-like enzyme
MDEVRYEIVKRIDSAELREFYAAQGHPAPASAEKLSQIIDNSVCFVTARTPDGRLIGIARGIADGVRGYLTECKLDPAYQGPAAVTATDGRIEHDHYGIARHMAEQVLQALKEMGCERIDVSAYGTEVDFCEELGFRRSAGQVPMTLDTKVMAVQTA